MPLLLKQSYLENVQLFNNQNIELITNPIELHKNLFNDDYYNTIVLMMSSGNFDGFNFKKFISHLENF